MTDQRINWNEESVQTLKRMWAAGATCSEIARAIPFATRNAVIRKVTRLKLPLRGRRSGSASPAPSPAKAEKKSRPANASMVILKPKMLPMKTQAPAQSKGSHDGKGITLLDLTNHSCRWPLGDPLSEDFLFCDAAGAKLESGLPYCPAHTRKANQL